MPTKLPDSYSIVVIENDYGIAKDIELELAIRAFESPWLSSVKVLEAPVLKCADSMKCDFETVAQSVVELRPDLLVSDLALLPNEDPERPGVVELSGIEVLRRAFALSVTAPTFVFSNYVSNSKVVDSLNDLKLAYPEVPFSWYGKHQVLGFVDEIVKATNSGSIREPMQMPNLTLSEKLRLMSSNFWNQSK